MGHLQMVMSPGVSESALLLQPGVNPDAKWNLVPF